MTVLRKNHNDSFRFGISKIFRKINEHKYYPKCCGREGHQSIALVSSHDR